MFIIVIKIMEGNQRYIEIKRNFKEYDELVRLVLKVEDTELQTDIMRAINSIPPCYNCLLKERADKATQTGEDGNFIDLKYADNVGKRKRKRSKKGPEVIHSSTSSSPVEKPKIQILSQKVITGPTSTSNSQPGTPEFVDDAFVDKVLSGNVLEVFPPQDDLEYIQKTMIDEFIACYRRVDGLFPVQAAIKDHDFKLFQRQLWVLHVRKIDLNSINSVFQDGEEVFQNLFELAIRNKCPIDYFENLIKYGLKVDTIDCFDGNNILHDIVNLSEDLDLLTYFLKIVPLDFLKDLNYDGYGVLHICAKKNQFRMIQVLLDHVDEVLNLKPLKFDESVILDDEDMYEQEYKQAFLTISERKQIHETKEAILNLKDTTSGRTPLLVALSSQHIHIVYMLLNHLADPSIIDYNGCDSQTFLNNGDKAKNKQLEDMFVNVSTILKELKG